MNYAWGSRTAIAELLGREASGQPEAELWMGGHSRGPSMVKVGDATLPLDQFIREDAERLLGEDCARRFGRQLPFLFKVLAAEEPLSLQLHPSLEQAREGYAREEASGVRLDDRARIYADPSHKPELLCALSPFEALSGFRPVRDGQKALSELGLGEPSHPLFEIFVSYMNSSDATGLERLVRALLALDSASARAAIDASVEAAARRQDSDDARLFLRIAAHYGSDPGAFLVPLLNYLTLEPGEALFVPAGVIHAYLRGTALEVMASSDNVLRAGLTSKPVHVAELLRLTHFDVQLPSVVRPLPERHPAGSLLRYSSPAPEFELAILRLEGGRHHGRGPALLLSLAGSVVLRSEGSELTLGRGEHAFLSAGEYEVLGDARLAIVRPNPRA